MKKLSFIILFISSSMIGFSQDYKTDLKKMYELYNSLENYYAEIYVKAYEGSTSGTPYLTKHTTVRKEGNKFFYELDNNIKMLVNNNFSILVNKEQKTIAYKPLKKPKKIDLNEFTAMSDMEEIIGSYKSVTFKGSKDGIKHYVILPNQNMIKAELFMKSSGLITKIIYEYKETNGETNKVVAEFKNSTTTPSFTKNTFSENQFFKKQGKEYIAVDKYKNYNLVKVEDYEF